MGVICADKPHAKAMLQYVRQPSALEQSVHFKGCDATVTALPTNAGYLSQGNSLLDGFQLHVGLRPRLIQKVGSCVSIALRDQVIHHQLQGQPAEAVAASGEFGKRAETNIIVAACSVQTPDYLKCHRTCPPQDLAIARQSMFAVGRTTVCDAMEMSRDVSRSR